MPYLSLAVDTDDATRWFIEGSDKDSVATDAVHVNTSTSLQVIEMDVTVLGDHEDDVVLGTHLVATKDI